MDPFTPTMSPSSKGRHRAVARRGWPAAIAVLSTLAVAAAVAAQVTVAASSEASSNAWAIRINSGGGNFTDSSGNQWRSDRYYTGGKSASVTRDIASTSMQSVYRSERWGVSSYRI